MVQRHGFINVVEAYIIKMLTERCFHIRKTVETEENHVTLVKEQCRLDIRKCSFSETTINEWNKLSTDYINGGSANVVKTTLTNTAEVRVSRG